MIDHVLMLKITIPTNRDYCSNYDTNQQRLLLRGYIFMEGGGSALFFYRFDFEIAMGPLGVLSEPSLLGFVKIPDLSATVWPTPKYVHP